MKLYITHYFLSWLTVSAPKTATAQGAGTLGTIQIPLTILETKPKIATDRIESNKIDKARKVLLFCGIGLILCSIIKFTLADSRQLTGLGWWADTIIIGALAIYFLLNNQKKFASRSGQFIEWTHETIIYKLKEETSPKTIERDKIKTIEIHLDTVEITNIENEKIVLDISDFDKYEDRLKIKDNFDREKNCA